jgi:antirestriction protein ArdC
MSETRTDLYARITDHIIAQLEAGIIPWVQPWKNNNKPHADYIGNWLQVLREDKRAIVQAASKASKASDYLLAFEAQDEMREAA